MLLELSISNFALIDNLTISLSGGLNILTGETGAGKSIIIDAVNIVLGERADKDVIRTGTDRAVVEACFDCSRVEGVKELLTRMEIELEDDGTLFLNREIKSGRSVSRVNGRPVSLSYIREISKLLIDIHGQHQHQSLLDIRNHLDILDQFGGEEILEQRRKIEDLYREHDTCRKLLDSITRNEMERLKNIDLFTYQIREIDDAELQIGEEEELARQKEVMVNAEKIFQALASSYQILFDGNGEEMTVVDGLNRISSLLSPFCEIDNDLSEFFNSVDSSCEILKEVSRDIRNYIDNIEFDQEKLNRIEERLDLINKLRRKYGHTIEEILDYRKEKAQELDMLRNSEQQMKGLNEKINTLEKKMKKECEILSLLRERASRLLEDNILDRIRKLGMGKAAFEVNMRELEDFTSKGTDAIEFLFSANLGEPLKPLSKIVSGGEMSRIMLAIKTSLAHTDKISTLIFDEIDVGISGRTAQAVAQQLAEVSQKHQVICVTHLPQIASMADNHYLIKKQENDGHTFTTLEVLDNDTRVEEMSRLLGGAEVTQVTYKHAREILDMAQKFKTELD